MHKPLWPQVLYGPSSKIPPENDLLFKCHMCLTGASHSADTCHHPQTLCFPWPGHVGADFQKPLKEELPWTVVQLRVIPWQTKRTTEECCTISTGVMLRTVLPSSYFMHMLLGEVNKRGTCSDLNERQKLTAMTCSLRTHRLDCSLPAYSRSTLTKGHKAFATPGDHAPDLPTSRNTHQTSQQKK